MQRNTRLRVRTTLGFLLLASPALAQQNPQCNTAPDPIFIGRATHIYWTAWSGFISGPALESWSSTAQTENRLMQCGQAIAAENYIEGFASDGPTSRVDTTVGDRTSKPGSNFYGIWTGVGLHWAGGWYIAPHTQDQYNGGNPPRDDDCPEGELRYDDGNGGSSECRPTPIIIHLKKGEVKKLTSPEDGVLFDIDADGDLDQVAWTPMGSKVAFLVIDKNGDGIIPNGTELIGSFAVPGAPNGFAALAALEPHDGNGYLDENDSLFAKLQLWTDENHNGVTDPGELIPASTVLEKIGLGYTPFDEKDKHGNVWAFKGWASFRDKHANRIEKLRDVYDILLATR